VTAASRLVGYRVPRAAKPQLIFFVLVLPLSQQFKLTIPLFLADHMLKLFRNTTLLASGYLACGPEKLGRHADASSPKFQVPSPNLPPHVTSIAAEKTGVENAHPVQSR
jgi:hypothetical protein